MLKNHDFSSADTQTQWLLTAIREQNPFSSLQLQTFQEKFLPQLAELYQTKPKQLETVLGTQTIYLERALLGWEEAQEQRRFKGKTEQLGVPVMYTGKVACMSISCGNISRDRTQNIMGSLAERTF